ncbi:MAG: hypothetical protein MRY78_19520 [Saprospiraceae bacterium]|nr:hypothetical protein [Saprospiraceae bacterium]
MHQRWFFYSLLFLFFITLQHSLVAQDTEKSQKEINLAKAKAAIKSLKQGILIVSLTSNHKKIKALQKLANSDQLSEKKRERVRDQLATTLAETAFQNKLIRQAFEDNYTFSEVRYIYDTANVHLDQLETAPPIFLGESLDVDPQLSWENEDILVARFGLTDGANTARAEAMMIMDAEMQELPDPFPHAIKMTTFTFVADKIFAPKEAFEKNINSRVKKLNKKFVRFYEAVLEDDKK